MSSTLVSAVLLGLLSLSNADDFAVSVEPLRPRTAGPSVLNSYVSYSIEFSSFPDFAGNLSAPNKFSDNLLNNIGEIAGTKPNIRVGGNTQDYYTYDPNLETSINGTYTPADKDYPTIIAIGKSYFESYQTWPNTQFVHGFNMAGNTTLAHDTLLTTAALACKALSGGKLIAWELGNEPDLFKKSAQFNKRPPTYNESDYVAEWLNKTRMIKAVVARECPQDPYGYYAPSFAGLNNYLNDTVTWALGLDRDKDITYISQHNYISGATSPGVTLAHTLLNHTMTLKSVSQYLPSIANLSSYNLPYIFGETNSLYNQGASGLSNSFGAALWVIDFNLLSASLGFRRVHMHMGTNYRYQSWQPIDTNITSKGTKAPYYGNVAVAASLGNIARSSKRYGGRGGRHGGVSVANIPLAGETHTAYAVYEGKVVRRVMLINMQQYNHTNMDGTPNSAPRPSSTYTLSAPGLRDGFQVRIQRLLANGSDSITGITWDGISYNYELNNGLPVRLHNVTTGEKMTAKNGKITITVPDSSAALVSMG